MNDFKCHKCEKILKCDCEADGPANPVDEMDRDMLFEYLEDTGSGTYENATIDNVNDCNGVVFFNERSDCGQYIELHSVSTFDLVRWMYNKFKG